VYRLSRVSAAADLEERFERPRDFDLAAFWAGFAEAFAAGLPRVDVLGRLDPGMVGAARAYAIEVRTEEPDADGWLPATLTFELPEHAVGGFLALGAGAELLEPADLRRRVAAEAAATASRYAE
jgi:predicted DNA-binding transcriptional regulator YafY